MFRANLLLLALFAVTAAFLYVAFLAARALGLLPEEQRYVMAAAGILAVVANFLIARQLMRKVLARTDKT